MTKLLRTAEVAELLGVAEGTLRAWRHSGVGPASFRLGARRVLYKEEDVMAWLEAQYQRAS